MVQLVRLAALSIIVALPSCDSGQASLVGAEGVAPIEILLRDTLVIIVSSRSEDSAGSDMITYVLSPGGDLIALREIVGAPGGPQFLPKGRGKFRLSPGADRRIRTLLGRVRPEEFGPDGPITRPNGCDGDDQSSFGVTVVFNRSPREEAILDLPQYCDTRDAKEARALVREVLRGLPTVPLS